MKSLTHLHVGSEGLAIMAAPSLRERPLEQGAASGSFVCSAGTQTPITELGVSVRFLILRHSTTMSNKAFYL
jgi:hypothetical protein